MKDVDITFHGFNDTMAKQMEKKHNCPKTRFVKAYSEYGNFDINKIINIVPTTGNCVAASMPLALATAIHDGRIQRGDLLYFIGTGAGLSMACALLTY